MGKEVRISFWLIFSFMSAIGTWAQTSLSPDDDGKVRLTINELAELAELICKVFGWKAEIVFPEDTTTDLDTD